MHSVKAAGSAISDQRVVIHGAGTAGIGIADVMRDQMVREGLAPEEATRRIWALGIQGLLTEDSQQLLDFQVPYARPSSELAAWSRPRGDGGYSLADVVARLGVTVARATRITDTMITASAQAVAALSEGTAGTSLLPPVTNLRMVSAAVALAVAGAAEKEGLAQAPLHDPVQQVHQAMWRPQYPSFEAI